MPYLGAVVNPLYQPAMRQISGITNASQATITTTFDHQYTLGAIVRIVIPNGYGMTQINNQTGTILALTSNTFVIDIDTSQYDPFNVPALSGQFPQVIPSGEIAQTFQAATHNTLRPPNTPPFS